MVEKTPLFPKMLASEAARILDTSLQNIHKKIKEQSLETFKSQNRVYFGHKAARELFDFQVEPRIFSFQLVKGGVGKTALSFNFAVRSCLLGQKTAIVELDQQGNLTRTCGIDPTDKPILIDIVKNNIPIEQAMIPVIDGLDILPSRVDNALLDNTLMLDKHPLDKVFTRLLAPLKQKYDVIVIDCPPSIGASVCAAALASDVIIMPVNPTDYAMAGLELTYKELSRLFAVYEKTPTFKILFNKYDARTALSFHKMSDLIKHETFGDMMISSYVKDAQTIENLISEGKSVFDVIRNIPEKEDLATITSELLEISKDA